MKKFLVIVFMMCVSVSAFASDAFSSALRTCQKYSQEGVIPYHNMHYNVLISLEKNVKKECVYKEKIYQGDIFHLLTCKFTQTDLNNIADSMEKYNKIYKNEISKNPIFQAKMSTNGDIFQTYLTNPKYCEVASSKQTLSF